MGNRPVNSRGQMLADPVTWNVYDRGYRGGAQASLFIGPVWVEEVLSIQVSTQTSDMPVYPYSSPYFGQLMLGNYQVTGQIGIAYTEPDYLLRIIETARNASIQDSELRELIEGRKSIFMDTVKYRLLTSKLLDQGEISLEQNILTEYATNYVQRITREIETSSLNRGGLNPQNFELTVVTGSLYGDTQSIEIFENVKIIGTGRVIANDDSSAMEVYQFIGRKKPDRTQRVIAPRDSYLLSRSNLIQLATEVVTQLVDAMLAPPKRTVYATEVRTSEMLSTDKIAIAGLLPRTPRMYGKQSSFAEIVYSLEFPSLFKQFKKLDGTLENIKSIRKVKLIRASNRTEYEVDAYLGCPLVIRNGNVTEEQGFDNRFGRIIFPDREQLAKHIKAVAPIKPIQTNFKRGGSIALPRYSNKEFGMGSYYPPEIVDLTTFDYDERKLDTITYGTLWCSTLGARSTNGTLREKREADTEEERLDNLISEITQPLNTMALVHQIEADWEESKTYFEMKFSAPRPIDFCNLHIPGKGKRVKSELKVGKPGNKIVVTFSKSGTFWGDNSLDMVTFEGPIKDEYSEQVNAAADAGRMGDVPSADWSVFEESRFDIKHFSHDAPPPSADNPSTLDPHYFELELKLSMPALASTMNKCIYVTPFVFLEGDTVRVPAGPIYVGTQTDEKLPSGANVSDYFATLVAKKDWERLAFYMKTREGRDDSCKVEIAYDNVVMDQSGYFDQNGRIRINGVYFLKAKDNVHLVRTDDGVSLDRRSFLISDYRGTGHLGLPKKVHIFWVASVMPLLHLPPSIKDEVSKVDIVHDISGLCGRYVELYNITRCDAMMHNATLLVNLDSGILNPIRNALVEIFRRIFPSIDAPVLSYTFPLKAMWERFAGFLSGYSFRIDVQRLTENVLDCSFIGNMDALVGRTLPARTDGAKWTLGRALQIAEREQREQQVPETENAGKLKESTYTELNTIIRGIIERKLQEMGGEIIQRIAGKGHLVIDVDNLLPASDVVAYGLTKDGYQDLQAMTAYNAAAGGDTVTNQIRLGGYEEQS